MGLALTGCSGPTVALQSLPVAHGRYLAEHISEARLVELPGDLPLFWDQPDRVLNVVEEFLVGAGRSVVQGADRAEQRQEADEALEKGGSLIMAGFG